jgi:prepilin-type N-terminal cleavage/methylation domain-containing protein/prepilin-type processing-associated H-X9-DG protein
MTRSNQRGLTLVEILVVIAIVGVLAAIIFPVTRNAVASARSTACLSNMRQLGVAMNLYANDVDDATPGASPFYLGKTRVLASTMGWAGKIYPYAKSTKIFACPVDGSPAEPSLTLAGSTPVSYAANENTLPKTLTELAGAKTVLLFEVSNSFAVLTKTDEGMTPRPTQFEKVSAIGNGVKGVLLDSFIVQWRANDATDIMYATGRLDNSDNDVFHDDFVQDSRHRSGANYLLIDGHAGWAEPLAVSAGSDAKSPSAAQSATGCFIWPATKGTGAPCAEGVAAGTHKFTFSSM